MFFFPVLGCRTRRNPRTLVSTYLGTLSKKDFYFEREDSRRIDILSTYFRDTIFIKSTEKELFYLFFCYNFDVYYYDLMIFILFCLSISVFSVLFGLILRFEVFICFFRAVYLKYLCCLLECHFRERCSLRLKFLFLL